MKSRLFLIKRLLLPGVICGLFCFSSCKQKNRPYEPTYTTDSSAKKILLFGVPTQSYYEIFDLFTKYLNKRLVGAQIQTVASSNFLDYMDKMDDRYYGLSIVNGMKALECARNGYAIISHAVDEQGNSGTILVNKDSAIKALTDLKGKTVATPGYPALPGHMLHMVYLQKRGVDVNRDIKFMYLQSFESVFMNIYLGRCSAGFCTTTSWNSFIKRRPEIASKVTSKWVTPAIIGNAILIRNDVGKTIADQLNKMVLSMHRSEEGRTALAKIGFLRFDQADSNSYQPVKDFLKEYHAIVTDQKR